MIESAWLVCPDPAPMLRHLAHDSPVSERKLRLLCWAIVGPSQADNWAIANYPDNPALWLDGWCRGMAGQPEVETKYAAAAHALREIVGNPHRPVTLPLVCNRCGKAGGRKAKDVNGDFLCCEGSVFVQAQCRGVITCPWLTPQALALAQSLYDCRDWSGLPALADMLEEAGCPGEEKCGECPKLRKARVDAGGYYDRDMVQEVIAHGKAKKACRCGGSSVLPHPLLAHLRRPGPHVRGCWALDLILSKS